MKQLSDLLDEVKAGAPPARYDVDDVVAAGKRRQRLRTSGWAAAAAVAVAVAVGVPRIASPGARPQPGPQPAATATVPTMTPEFTFTGFTAGDLRVADPSEWSLAGQTANIRRPGSPDVVGTLTVYHPGVDPVPGGHRQQDPVTDIRPAGGRRAFQLPRSTPYGGSARLLIGWEYADGAVATVEGEQNALTRAELKQVAESFAIGRRRPVTLAFRPSRLPAGYRVVSIVSDPNGVTRSAVTLVAADQAAARLARPGREASPVKNGESASFLLEDTTTIDVPAGLRCTDREPPSTPMRICSTRVPGLAALLTVRSLHLGADDLATTEVRDPAKPATWWPVGEVIGASAMPPAK